VGPRAGLDGCEKSRPPPGFDSRTVLSVASRYTDDALSAQGTQRMCIVDAFSDACIMDRLITFQPSMTVVCPLNVCIIRLPL
jgi:hypothetical protein